jgi:hypothetical protein
MKASGILCAAAIALLASALSASAQTPQWEGPWCAAVNIGTDSTIERCDMRSFEMCLEEIRSNQGSCVPNPRYTGRQPDPRRAAPRREPR